MPDRRPETGPKTGLPGGLMTACLILILHKEF